MFILIGCRFSILLGIVFWAETKVEEDFDSELNSNIVQEADFLNLNCKGFSLFMLHFYLSLKRQSIYNLSVQTNLSSPFVFTELLRVTYKEQFPRV